jgi:heat-inducible transcriptional repressor
MSECQPVLDAMTRPLLDERLRRILTFVVECHVSRGEPVGSQYVRAAYHLSISPATIRNAMQQLEEMGFLGHPHTSAGRVPTEAGYRYYVDELMRPEPVRSATRRAVSAKLTPVIESGEFFSPLVPRILARLSGQLAVVAVRAATERVVERVDLVSLEDGLLLLALGDAAGPFATATWKPDPIPSADRVRRAERWIRACLPLQGSRGLHASADRASREAAPEIASTAADALARAARLLASASQPAVRIDGADNIAAQPEFQSPARLRPLVSLLADREELALALEAFTEADRALVSIGRENGSGAMRDCSLVGMRIESRGVQGLVGLLGPVRMPYRRLVSLITYVGERMSEGS